MKSWIKTHPCPIFLATLAFVLFWQFEASAQDLQSDLETLRRLRKGKDTSLSAVDEEGEKLLRKYKDPKERGRIYYELAHIFAQSGMTRPESVVEYAQKALELPLEPSMKSRLYVYWGDALQIGTQAQPFSQKRKAAANIYLAGLRDISTYGLPDKAPELRQVSPVRTMGELDDPRQTEARRKYLAAWAEREKAEFQIEMIKHRDVLIGQIVGLYARKPYACDELRDLAGQTLGDAQMVDQLLEKVQQKAPQSVQTPAQIPLPPAGPGSLKIVILITLAILLAIVLAIVVWKMVLSRRPSC